MDQQINAAVRLQDDRSFMRRQFFRLFALNSMDAIKFYYFMGEKSRTPVVGPLLKALMTEYYHHVHTAAVKLPRQDIEDVINAADHVSVGPCGCRAIFGDGKCDAPMFACIKINYFSRFTTAMEKLAGKLRAERGMKVGNPHSKALTKEEAIEIVRNARRHGLVLSLESCIEPYQYNICCCCADCCIELNMRYKFGLDVSPRGPYEPVVNAAACKGCGACAKRCPVNAITLTDQRAVIDLNQCLGCGVCAEQCKQGALTMVLDERRIPSYEKPGLAKLSYVYLLAFATFLVFTGYKLTHKSENVKYFLARPRPSDVIQ
jgi:Pyruvate/2-oxoacid:ferredoxin oxidoreductase delta subunit